MFTKSSDGGGPIEEEDEYGDEGDQESTFTTKTRNQLFTGRKNSALYSDSISERKDGPARQFFTPYVLKRWRYLRKRATFKSGRKYFQNTQVT